MPPEEEEEEGSFNISLADTTHKMGVSVLYVRDPTVSTHAPRSPRRTERFPVPLTVPPLNIFEGKVLSKRVNASKVIDVMETYLVTATSVGRALGFTPKNKDVIVVSAPHSGELKVSRIVRLLQSDLVEESLQDTRGQPPLLESRHMDEDQLALVRPQSASGRVFRTAMTLNTLKPRQKTAGKFIAVLRHPVDLKASWVSNIKEWFDVPAKDEAFPKFDAVLDSDAFAGITVSLCNTTGTGQTYEAFVMDWVQEARSSPEYVLPVFFESVLSTPEVEIRRIARFLGLAVPDEFLEAIVEDIKATDTHSAGSGAAAFAKKASLDMMQRDWEQAVVDYGRWWCLGPAALAPTLSLTPL
jgi:hypothetical protein